MKPASILWNGEIIVLSDITATKYVANTRQADLTRCACRNIKPLPFLELWLRSNRKVVITDIDLIGKLLRNFSGIKPA